MCAESGKDARAATGVNHDEAGRDGAAEDRSSTERRIQALLAAAPFGAHVYELRKDESLVFLGGNPAADRILGVDNSQFVGKTIEAAFPALTQTEVPQAYRRVALTGEPYEGEQCAYDENGIQGVYDLHAFQIGSRKMAVFFQDITERKKAEEELKKSEEKFAQAFLLSPDAVNINRLSDGVYLDINHGFTATTGYAREEVLGRSSVPGDLGIWVNAEDRARLLGDLKQYGEVSGMVVPFRRKDGSIIIGMMSAKAIEVEGEKCILSVTRDVTERTKAEDALRESEETLSATLNSISDGFYSLDDDLVFTYFNAAAERMLARRRADVIGRSLLEVFPNLKGSDIEVNYRNAVKDKVSVSFETYLPASSRFYDVRVYPQPVGISVYFQNITERRQAEEALRLDDSRLQALLELSQMTKVSMQELAAFAMEEAVRLTGSTVGYVAFVTEDESTLTMYAWSRQAMAECAVQEKPLVYPVESTGLWGEAVRQRRPIITNDYSAPNPWKKGVPEGHVRVDRHMNVPIFDEGRIVVVAGVGNKPTDYDESDVRQLTLLMDGMWRIIRRNRAEEELRRSELDKRQFYRDTIRSVTDGKLDITGYEELTPYTGNSADVTEFSSVAELSDVRMQVTEFCLAAGMREDSTGLFLTAVGEALTNAVKHARKGKSRRGMENGQVWVAVWDAGPGIAALSLPDATLRRGYSTKASMGLGYSIMLDVCDRIMLCTGTEGTTVVLFRNVEESRPMLSLENLPDTWEA